MVIRVGTVLDVKLFTTDNDPKNCELVKRESWMKVKETSLWFSDK